MEFPRMNRCVDVGVSLRLNRARAARPMLSARRRRQPVSACPRLELEEVPDRQVGSAASSSGPSRCPSSLPLAGDRHTG
jgi:hypothetical protein